MLVASPNADRALSVIAHASFWVFPLVVPLALYYFCRHRRPWVAAHASEAFNFQLSLLATFASLVAIATLGVVPPVAVLAVVALWLWAAVAAISRLAAAADDTLKPYGGPVFHVLARPALPRSAAL